MDDKAELETINHLRTLVRELCGSIDQIIFAFELGDHEALKAAIEKARATAVVVNPPPPQPKE